MRFLNRTILPVLLAASAFLAAGTAADAATLYGSAFSGADGLAVLYRIDPATGAPTRIGPIGFQRVGSLDFGPDGRLYGVGERDDGTDTVVVLVIDTATGVGTEIAPLSFVGPSRPVSDISFRPSDGMVHAFLGDPDEVAVFEASTGIGAVLGPPGTTGGGHGIAFSRNLTLYHWEDQTLYTIDQTTGLSSLLGVTTFTGFPPLTTPRVDALDVDPDGGTLYASVNDGGAGGGGPGYLAKLDPAALAIEEIGSTVDGLEALAFQPDRCPVVLYGAEKGGGAGARLVTIDPISGAASDVGPIHFDNVGGMDFDPLTGVLYGIAIRPADGVHVLITIDPATGSGTEVGPLVNAGNPLGGGTFDLSFRSDGTLLASAFPAETPSLSLFRVDTSTGLAIEIGPTGTGAPGNGLAFSLQDALYMADNSDGGTLYGLEPSTGTATALSSLTFLGFPPLDSPRLNALDTDPSTGVTWASVNDGFRASGPSYLAWIDPRTGSVRHAGLTLPDLDALAWAPLCDDGDPCTIDECVRCRDARLLGASYALGGPATLVEIDPLTGTSVSVGAIGFDRVSAMDYDPETGILYATGERPGTDINVLIAIDPGTGAGHEIGPTNIGAPGGTKEPDLSIRFLDGKIFAYLDNGDELATLDRLSGRATLVGPSGVSGIGNGLAFESSSALIHTDGNHVNVLDQAAGTAVAVAPLSYAGFPPPVVAYRVNALDAACDGRLFASVRDGNGTGPDYLATLDPNSGVVTHVGATDGGLDALAWITQRGFCTHPKAPDSDFDSVCDAIDCAPANQGVWSVPPDITDGEFVDSVHFVWGSLATVSGRETFYDAVAGEVGELPVGPTDASSLCRFFTASLGLNDPLPGEIFWVVVRGHTTCGAGPWGDEDHAGVLVPRATMSCP